MTKRIADKEFLSKNLYQVMVRGNQYESWDAKKSGVKSMMNKQSKLPKEPPFPDVNIYHYQRLIHYVIISNYFNFFDLVIKGIYHI